MELPNQHNSYGYIYCTTNLVDSKKYIGQHAGKAEDRYIGSGKYFKRAVKTHGRESFQKEILQFCIDADDLNESEIYWIDYFGAYKSDLFYNFDKGGNCPTRGIPMTQEAKDHLSKLNKGKGLGKKMNLNDEQRARIGAPRLGKSPSEETRKKMSVARIGTKLSEATRLKMSESGKGGVVSEETRDKISKGHTGKTVSEETREKLRQVQLNLSEEQRKTISDRLCKSHLGKKQSSETIEKRASKLRGKSMHPNTRVACLKAKIGSKWTEEAKANMSANRIGKMVGKENHKSREVVKLDLNGNLIDTYVTISVAAKSFGKNRATNINNVLSGFSKTAYGFKWMYLENYNKLNNI